MYVFDQYLFNRLDELFPGMGSKVEKEREKYIKFIIYLRQIIAGAVSMIDIENCPETLDFRYLEIFRYCNGHVGIKKDDTYGIVCFPGTFAGELDAYGRGSEYVGSLLNGTPESGKRTEIKGKVGIDTIVIPNNYLYTPDFPILYSFAKRLAEVDTSLDMNVFYSRLAPLIKVRDDKVKQAVDQILNNIFVGELKSIMSDDMEPELEGLKSIDVVNITDVNDVDKIQYLSKYHDDLLRRLYVLGGHSMAGTQKMAQQSSDEISQNDTIAMIYPMERLNALKIGIEKANKLFNLEMIVKFSEPWTVEKEKIESSIAAANQMQSASNEPMEDTNDENIERVGETETEQRLDETV